MAEQPASEHASQLVLVEKRDGYAVVTLNRPEKRNAMNAAAQAALAATLEALKADTRVVVLTGAGSVSFCSGVDLSERLRPPDGTPRERRFAHGSDSWLEVQEAIRRHPAIFVAAVNGYALGGGLTLVHNADLAIAAETATFGLPEINVNLFPALSGAATLHRILPKHAAFLILTGRRVDAYTAERWGIVNEVVPPADLLPRAEELAASMAKWDPLVLDYTKKAIREIPTLEWSRALDYGLSVNQLLRAQAVAPAGGVPSSPPRSSTDASGGSAA